MFLTYALLAIAICAVWLPSLSIKGHAVAPWSVLYVAAVTAALAARIVDPIGAAVLALLAGSAIQSTRTTGWPAALLTSAAVALALALSLHLAPGFHNPTLFLREQISTDGVPFTQYLNFDKGSVGLIFLAVYTRRGPGVARTGVAAVAVVSTPVAVLAMAIAAGYVHVDLKWPAMALAFLAANLLFTVIAEEAFFRGFVQARIEALACRSTDPGSTAEPGGNLRGHPARYVAVVALSGALFGIAHIGGGPLLALLATVAGIGYAIAFSEARRIEAAIVAHFVVNAVHFLGFTYPALAR
jgi:membrane protease YdiL (CAAX protease family)